MSLVLGASRMLCRAMIWVFNTLKTLTTLVLEILKEVKVHKRWMDLLRGQLKELKQWKNSSKTTCSCTIGRRHYH